MSGAKILVVDDDLQIRRVMRKMLTSQGYAVNDARSGEEALEVLRRGRHDLVLLDLAMPGMGGLEACRAIRAGWDLAIIILSVRGMEKDKISALDAGADDYVTKPFSMQELLARIRAGLRRSPLAPEAAPQVMQIGELEINFAARRVISSGHEVRLTRKEFDLLQYLAASPNTPIPHRRLLQAVWGPDYGNEVVYLRVFINQLRKKIEPEPAKPRYILTEPCVGYQFHTPAEPKKEEELTPINAN
ncbi:MAG TPA: response regulator transcription factor [Bryobacteraceae bacterium]|nr:response regulator transcription factor [Bryobacteraceae bacterium]